MLRIDLQRRLVLGHVVAGFAQQAGEMRCHLVVVQRKARRRIGEARGDAHVTDAIAEQFLELLQQRLGFLGCRFLLLLVGFVQRQLALGDVLQFLAAVLAEAAEHPFVDAIGHQQHFDTLGLECFQLRAAQRGGVAVGSDEPDRVLAHRHATDVIIERDGLRTPLAFGRGKTQQLGDALAVVRILADAFLQRVAERLVERGELLRLILGQLLDQVEHALDAGRLDAFQLPVLLQDLATDVERQIIRVDHAAHETQVVRQQLFSSVHDEDALDVELESFALIATAHRQVERRLRGDVQQRGEALAALDAVVRPGQRVVEIVAE